MFLCFIVVLLKSIFKKMETCYDGLSHRSTDRQDVRDQGEELPCSILGKSTGLSWL